MFEVDSVVQLVMMTDDAVLGGVIEVVVSNPSWGECFSASNDISDLFNLSVLIFPVNLHQFLISFSLIFLCLSILTCILKRMTHQAFIWQTL